MKKILLAIAFIVAANCVWAQYRGVTVGIIPGGTNKVDAYTHNAANQQLTSDYYKWTNSASFSNPGFKICLEVHDENRFCHDRGYVLTYQPMDFSRKSGSSYIHNAGTGTMIAFTRYFGWTILYGHRIQFPIYLGWGFTRYSTPKEETSNMENLMFLNFSASAMMDFYITNRIYLYGGYSFHRGFHLRLNPTEDSSTGTYGSSSSTTVQLKNAKEHRMYPEFGIAFRF
ncbi:MAG: hypothetical protein K5864_09765 [Bacteroidales bacterium]|nr:hypothetical protein [Bacteroidales bacterium]